MSEEEIKSAVREFVDAYARRDVEKLASFLADDVVWAQSEGTFKGKEEAKRFLTWEAKNTPGLRLRDAGLGILVKGSKAIYEHVFDSTSLDGGASHDIPAVGVFEFKDGKIQRHRLFYDRLSVAKQAAKGWVARNVVGAVVNGFEKGLR